MEFQNYTRKKLIKYCQQNKIKKYSRKRNSQIIEIITTELQKRKKNKKSEKAFVFPTRSWTVIMSFCKGMKQRKKIKQRALYDEETLINALELLLPVFNKNKLEIGKQIRWDLGSKCYDIYSKKKIEKSDIGSILEIITNNIPGNQRIFCDQINAKTRIAHKVSKNIIEPYELTEYTRSRKYKQQQNCKIPQIITKFIMPYMKYAFQDCYITDFENVVDNNSRELQIYIRDVPRLKRQMVASKKEHETAEKKLFKLKEEQKTLDMDENFVIFIDDNAIDFKIIHYNREKEIVTFYNEIYGEIQIPVPSKAWYRTHRSQIVQRIICKIY